MSISRSLLLKEPSLTQPEQIGSGWVWRHWPKVASVDLIEGA